MPEADDLYLEYVGRHSFYVSRLPCGVSCPATGGSWSFTTPDNGRNRVSPRMLATALLLRTHDLASPVAGSKGNQPDAGGFQAGDDGEARRSACLSARISLASLPTMSRAMSPVKNLALSLPYLPRPRVSPRHDSNLLPKTGGPAEPPLAVARPGAEPGRLTVVARALLGVPAAGLAAALYFLMSEIALLGMDLHVPTRGLAL